jgi:4-hydroxybenzoate polyprenyltransferase
MDKKPLFSEFFVKYNGKIKEFSFWLGNILLNGLMIAIAIWGLFGAGELSIRAIVGLGFTHFMFFDILKKYNSVKHNG